MRSRASSPLIRPLSEIAAIILAAGLSSRFEAGPEETKLVVPLCGKPLVRHVAEAALASRARPILVESLILLVGAQGLEPWTR